MFGSFGKVFNGLSPIVFSNENKPKLTIAALITGANVAINVVSPYVFSETVTTLTKAGGSYNFYGLEVSPVGMVYTYGVVWAIGRILPVMRKIAINSVASNTSYDLVHKCMDRVLNNRSHSYHVSTPYSETNELLQKCILGTGDFVSQLFTQVIPTAIDVTTAGLYLALKYDWPISLSLTGIIIIYAGYNNFKATDIINVRTEMLKARFQSFSQIASIRNNYETIHIFSNTKYELKKLKRVLDSLDNAVLKNLNIPDKISVNQMIFIGVGFTGLLTLVANKILNGQYDLNDFLIVNYYLAQFANPLNNFGEGVSKVRAATIDLDKVFDFLNNPSEVKDDNPHTDLNVSLNNAEVKFEDVVFGYDTNSPILKGVTFTAPAGKKTGIVGISGKQSNLMKKKILNST